MTGLRVIIEGMNMGFLLLAYNQISNNAGMLHYTSGGQYKVWTCSASNNAKIARAVQVFAIWSLSVQRICLLHNRSKRVPKSGQP